MLQEARVDKHMLQNITICESLCLTQCNTLYSAIKRKVHLQMQLLFDVVDRQSKSKTLIHSMAQDLDPQNHSDQSHNGEETQVAPHVDQESFHKLETEIESSSTVEWPEVHSMVSSQESRETSHWQVMKAITHKIS